MELIQRRCSQSNTEKKKYGLIGNFFVRAQKTTKYYSVMAGPAKPHNHFDRLPESFWKLGKL